MSLALPPHIMSSEAIASELYVRGRVVLVDPRWIEVDAMPGQVAWINRHERLSVIMSAAPRDDKAWLHLSVAGRTQLPTWDQLVRVKELFLGPEAKAIQVIAPRSQWVNQHPHCLHLWECLSGDVLPDFTDGTGSI